MNSLYERYHLKPKLQKRIISEKSFTYRNLFGVLKRYLKPSETILDVGCGVGTMDFYLASKGNIVTGLDISKSAIDIARRNASLLGINDGAKFEVGSFPDTKVRGEFDVILMSEVIEHLPDDKSAIKECYKNLKRNGILILSTRSENEVLYRLGFEKTHDKRVGHLRRYTVDGLKRMIRSSGFSILEVRRTEGLLRDSLFVFPKFGDLIVKVANKFGILSDLLSFLDDIFLRLFGESQIYIIAKK